MKTVNIKINTRSNAFFPESIFQKQKEILVSLYKDFLKDDPLFHFFYEPELIIRISKEEVLKKVKKYLKHNKINFITYDYPSPKQTTDDYLYGEEPDGIVVRNLELFLTIFHAHSVAALELDNEDHFHYMERVIHTMWNPKGYTREEEGKHLAKLAEYKLGYALEPSATTQNNQDEPNTSCCVTM